MMDLMNKFKKEIRPRLAEKMGIKNPLQVPALKKIVVSVGMASEREDKKLWEEAEKQLALITGQKPVRTKAKKAISGFKLRAGDEVGLKVTLRKKRMYDFFEKLVKVVLPRMRDFQGLELSAFDGQGNYNIGFSEQMVFPEVNPAEVTKTKGVEVTIVMTTDDDKKAKVVLGALGMPFKKEE